MWTSGLLGCLLFLCLSRRGYHTSTISSWVSWFPICWFAINLSAVVLCMPWFAIMVAPRCVIPPLLIVVGCCLTGILNIFWTRSDLRRRWLLSFSSHAILPLGLMHTLFRKKFSREGRSIAINFSRPKLLSLFKMSRSKVKLEK